MKPTILFLFAIILLSGTASAGDESWINQGLQDNAGSTYTLPSGTHIIEDTIFVPSNTVFTADTGAKIKLEDDAGWPAYQGIIEPTESSTENIIIENFEIDGNQANQDEPTGEGYYICLLMDGCDNLIVRNMYMHDNAHDAVRVFFKPYTEGQGNLKVYNNRFHRCAHDDVYMTHVSGAEIYNNDMISRTNVGVRALDSNHVKIYDNVIDPGYPTGGHGIQIQKSNTEVTMDDIEVSNNEIKNTNLAGIALIGYGGDYNAADATGVYIHDNRIEGCGESPSYSVARGGGITIQGFDNTIIENNVIDSCYQAGILISEFWGDAPDIDYKVFLKKNTIINTQILSKFSDTGYGIKSDISNVVFYSEGDTVDTNSIGDYLNINFADGKAPEQKPAEYGLEGDENIITVSGCDGESDQEQINQALEQAEPGYTVFLPAKTYLVDGPINIQCSGVTLLGEEGTIIKVAKTDKQWFKGLTGIINSVGFDDITIKDLLVDGSCDELDNSLADSSSATSHDCERAIVIQGSSGDFVKNIVIKNVIVINTFSDGVHVRCAENVIVDSCEMSNCQHDSIYFVLVRNGVMKNNEIAGITADCTRFDNCEYSKAVYNTLFSYSGSQSNGAYLHGENAVQIGDQGHSYGGGDPGKSAIIHTNNIEIAYNKIINCGLEAVLLDAAGLGLGENIYIHDNDIIGDEEFETSGVPVEVLDGIEDVKNGKTPTQEQSEEVFDSIFDIFNMKFSETGNLKQGTITVTDPEWKHKGKYTDAYIYLAGYEGEIIMNGQKYIPDMPSKCAIIKTDTRNTARHSSGQTSSLTLTDLKDGSLKATLKVTTKYKVKDYKTVTVLGRSVKVPYYKNKKETVSFKQTFDAPAVFPVLSADDINVSITYQNNSYNPHATITVTAKDGNTDAITGVSYEYNGSTANEYRQIGYVTKEKNGFQSANFKETFTWKFSDESMSYSYQELYIKGVFDPANLHIIVRTPFSEIVVNEYNYVEVGDPMKTKINPAPFVIVIVIFIIIRPLLQEFDYKFKR